MEIKSIEIGEIMMSALKEVDSVAYVRFASVYRDFQDIKDFSEEINSLNKEKPKKKIEEMNYEEFMLRAISEAEKYKYTAQTKSYCWCNSY